jgi:hypothetical protein
MAIKTIPFSRLEADLKKMLDECADTGEALVVEMPDHRMVAIQAVDAAEDDSLIDDLLANDPEFRSLVEKSKASPRKVFKH